MRGLLSRRLLSVPPLQQRISYRIISFVWRSLLGLAPGISLYLRGLCCTTMGIPSRRSLRSAERGFLIVPFARTTTTKQNRSFSTDGPSLWNGLSLALRLYPWIPSNSFYANLKTFPLFHTYIYTYIHAPIHTYIHTYILYIRRPYIHVQ